MMEHSSWTFPVYVMGIMDPYVGIFPKSNKELHIVYQIFFRYWDLFSILGPIKLIYQSASIETPKWVNLILRNLIETFTANFQEEFKNIKPYDQAALESRLNGITANLHTIIDTAFNSITNAQGGSRKTRKWFFPKKYFAGLSQRKKTQRKKEIKKFGSRSWKSPKAYLGFKTDRGVKTRKSSYTASWNRKFPNVKSLEDRAKVTGVPLRFIKESYNRGMAAWRTGHRPGATEQQWGYARVSSFLLCGKTFHTTDSDLARKAKGTASARAWWKKQGC